VSFLLNATGKPIHFVDRTLVNYRQRSLNHQRRSERSHRNLHSRIRELGFRLSRKAHGRRSARGFFVSFDYTSDAMTEIGRYFRQTGKVIVPFTVSETLNEQIAQELA
jgi:hypothetical protein